MSEPGNSAALRYVISKGWAYREGNGQIAIENCPISGCGNYHFYMAVGNKDGLWDCKKCGKSGNLGVIQEKLGDKLPGVSSQQDWANGHRPPEPFPNVEACHKALLDDEEALDYLIGVRGFTMAVIERQRLGVTLRKGRRSQTEKKWIVIPYLQGDNVVYAKYRTIPPAEKDFDSPSGWDAPLYNQQVIQPGVEELIFVEGEADALALMCQGVDNVLGVPGANLKKTLWVELLDQCAPKKIYILYDKDRVGQKGAQELAARIGIEKCYKLLLPDFEIENDDGTTRPGKDVNEWFRYGGGTLEKFEELKLQARQFDVKGVASVTDALDEMERELEGKDMLKPTYDFKWPSVSRKVGAEPGDCIDVLADGKVGKTTWGLNQMDYICDKYGVCGLVYCLEMSNSRMARKWLSMATQTDDSLPVDDEDAKKKLKALKEAIPRAKEIVRAREGDLLFAHGSVSDCEEVYETIRQAVRRYGVKWVMFDNIQLLCDKTLRNQNHRTIHLSQISKNLKDLAMSLNIVMLRIIQPGKISRGEIADAGNVDGSSQIVKDCDALIVLHRALRAGIKAEDFEQMKFLDSDVAMEPEMLTGVRRSRYSGGGLTTLLFNGSTSTVTEFSPEKRAEIEAQQKKIIGNTVPQEEGTKLPGVAAKFAATEDGI